MEFVSIIPVILISIFGTITDIRYGRVKNSHLLITLGIWVVLVVIKSIFIKQFVLNTAWGINICLAFVASLIFYLTDIWAPGDCKMYISIALVFPMNAYIIKEGNVFPALDFIIYSFAIGYIVLLVGILSRQFADEHKSNMSVFSFHFSWRRAHSILSNIGIFLAIDTLLYFLIENFYQANLMFCTLLIIGLICLIQETAPRIRLFLGSFGLLYYFVQAIIYRTWYNNMVNLGISIVLSVVLEIVNDASHTNTYRMISGDEVKPGMILSYTTIIAMQNCIDPIIPHTTTENRRSRLTKSQAEAVKAWCNNAKSDVVIVEMIPFAPFIALSVGIIILQRYFV